MYLIVEFVNEGQTGPVAKSWYMDGFSWWPPYKDQSRLLKSVKKAEVPHPDKGWKKHSVRILYESALSSSFQSGARAEQEWCNKPSDVQAVDRTVLEALREMDLKTTYLTSLVESFVGGRRILPPQQVQDEEEMNIFPLNSVETLEDLEKRLLNNGLKQRMTNTLSLSGGHTMKKTIWRIASKVFTPNLAKSLNWCGRGDKRGLKQTACGQLIIAAAVKNPALPAPTEAEAEKCLKDFLRLAPARR
ncbi:hypothetical protein SRHO_G00011190 [Serrasalmus rhombeus]